MLSLHINTIQQIVTARSTTPDIIGQINSCCPGHVLPWIDDNIIVVYTNYLLIHQSIESGTRLADKIWLVDPQVTRQLIHSQPPSRTLAERSLKVTNDLRQIYKDYRVVIHPIEVDAHWFLVIYSDNVFRVYDSMRNGISEDAMAKLDSAIFGPTSMKRRDFASPTVFQNSYWECGYFTCSIIESVIRGYDAATSQVAYPTDKESRIHAEASHCHTIAKQIASAYDKCVSFFL